MKKLVYFLVLAIFATQCANSVSLRRRRSDESATANQDTGVVSMLENGVEMMESLPFVGGGIKFGSNWITDTMNAMQDLTNGGLARVLGGALPCVISMENGLKCSGITDDNNISVLLMGIVGQIPMLGFANGFIGTMLNTFLNPVVNGVLGGAIKSPS